MFKGRKEIYKIIQNVLSQFFSKSSEHMHFFSFSWFTYSAMLQLSLIFRMGPEQAEE